MIKNAFILSAFLLCAILIIGCKEKPTQREVHQPITTKKIPIVKNPKDLDLIRDFIAQNPSTEKFDSLISLYLNLQDKIYETEPPPPWHCGNMCLKFHFDSIGEVLESDSYILNELIASSALEILIKESTKDSSETFRSFKEKDGTERFYSKGHFVIVLNENSIKKSQEVVIQLSRAFETYKEILSKKWYQVEFRKLENPRKEKLNALFYRKIIYKRGFIHPTLIPPAKLNTK